MASLPWSMDDPNSWASAGEVGGVGGCAVRGAVRDWQRGIGSEGLAVREVQWGLAVRDEQKRLLPRCTPGLAWLCSAHCPTPSVHGQCCGAHQPNCPPTQLPHIPTHLPCSRRRTASRAHRTPGQRPAGRPSSASAPTARAAAGPLLERRRLPLACGCASTRCPTPHALLRPLGGSPCGPDATPAAAGSGVEWVAGGGGGVKSGRRGAWWVGWGGQEAGQAVK